MRDRDQAPPDDPPRPRRRRASIALIGIGLLILIPAGLGTAILVVGALLDAVLGGAEPDFSRRLLSLIVLFGAPPTVLGAVLLAWGWRRDRR